MSARIFTHDFHELVIIATGASGVQSTIPGTNNNIPGFMRAGTGRFSERCITLARQRTQQARLMSNTHSLTIVPASMVSIEANNHYHHWSLRQ